MPKLEDWIQMYSSDNPAVRHRAAEGLLGRSEEVPLDLLVDILLNLHNQGLGAKTEKALLKRRDSEMVPRMVAILESQYEFVREVACNVLGHLGDKAATQYLLRMCDDPHMMVRRAAGFALAFLKDRSAHAQVQTTYERHKHDDINVVMALECALRALGESCQ